ncbi:CHAT domain-containing protein [Allocatelliglobosispora scoriae]|uniref:CHAT domain-containing protein n=1 Tax=Allocatelliglobosispora scoriae TaxID=643052 RepID=A0A841BJ57_9ACTN|nr:CHAT domain-containing protein [Allocatelliglobosispora scoriae]MBB5866812.1 CHAT domain-containing protein [Allocatelliglobosispora scoriae]
MKRGEYRQLTAAVQSSLDRHSDDGNIDHLLSGEARAAADQLFAALRPMTASRRWDRILRRRFGGRRVHGVRAVLAEFYRRRGTVADPLDPYRAMALYALVHRRDPAGVPPDLIDLVAVLAASVGVRPWMNLALHARHLFMQEDQLSRATIDRSVDLARVACAVTCSDTYLGAQARGVLSACVAVRYQVGPGTPEDLAEAGRAADEALDYAREWAQSMLMFSARAAGAMRTLRYEATGDATDLDDAVTILREAIEAVRKPDHDDLAEVYSGLCWALRLRYTESGDRTHLDDAITVGELSCDAAITDVDDFAVRAATVMGVLALRFEHFRDIADLDRSIELGQRARALLGPRSPRQDLVAISMMESLKLRYLARGGPPDLTEAVQLGAAALAVVPGNLQLRLDLAGAYCTRFQAFGDIADINAAIDTYRRADLAKEQPWTADLCRELTNFSIALRSRFEHSGAAQDLEESIALCRLALDGATLPPDTGPALESLGKSLIARHEITEDPDDLRAAVQALTDARDAYPPSHLRHHTADVALTFAMLRAAKADEDPAVLDRAIEHTGRLAASNHTTVETASVLYANLGSTLHLRWRRTGSAEDLELVVDALRRCLALTPADHIEHGRRVGNLATALRLLPAGDARIEESNRLAADTLADELVPAHMRMRAGAELGEALARAGRWSEAAQVYARCVALLPLVAMVGMPRHDGERALAAWPTLAADAAACALQAGDERLALQVLEHGRAVLWQQLIDTDSDLGELAGAHPDLAEQLRELREAIDRQPGGMWAAGMLGHAVPHQDPAVEGRVEMVHRWNRLTTTIRELPGFASFLAPPGVDELLAAGAEGPVAIINVSGWRCDALIVGPHGLAVVPLAGLTKHDVYARSNAYLDALREFEEADLTAQTLDRLETTLNGTVEWLWDVIAEPVLDSLALGPSQRLWWCPTGPLTLLPLQAAGYHGADDGRAVVDRVVSSSTPTLSALIRSRLPRPRARRGEQVLFVGVPETEGMPRLLNVGREQAALTALLPAGTVVAHTGADATRRRVREELPDFDVMHLSCHGVQVLGLPSEGGIMLHDGMLTVTELGSLRSSGELAFLAACMTATGGLRVPDEAVSLAAALYFSGWRDVVGTLWTVLDTHILQVTTAFYRELRDADGVLDPGRSAVALHAAVRELRDRDRSRPSTWMSFLHIGR